jgi:hypothetical protein
MAWRTPGAGCVSLAKIHERGGMKMKRKTGPRNARLESLSARSKK